MIYIQFTGGLGNQLFQYSACRNLQMLLKQDVRCSFLSKTHESHAERELSLFRFNVEPWNVVNNEYFWNKHRIRRVFYAATNKVFYAINKNEKEILSKLHCFLLNKLGVYQQQAHQYFRFYKPIFFIKDVYVDGMFHHPMFTETCKKEMQQSVHLIESEKVNEIMELLKYDSNNTVAVHIRRGDYLTVAGFKVCSSQYYLEGMKYIRDHIQNAKFLIFSDDIAWCKENIEFENVIYMQEGQPDYIDFELMRNCDHFVISNSTYSWWAAYLGESKGKIVVTPKSWFDHSTKEWLNFEDWIEIEN